MIGYKVVTRTDEGILRSANYGLSSMPEPRAFTVDYTPNELTLPKLTNTKLLAFSSKETAINFMFCPVHEVWLAELIQPVKVKWICNAETGNLTTKCLKSFWSQRSSFKHRMCAPNGTVACKGIILKEKIISKKEFLSRP